MPVITVTQINKYIGFMLKGDRNLQGIAVKGEIADFVCHYRSGHMYFTLKDSESTIKAVMFASAASRLRFRPEDGMSVVVTGSVGVYEPGGVYQLYANDIIPDGAGKASVALEQLRKKLAKEGIFDQSHKRPLPAMPKKIGVVTSLSGAAVRDVINVLTRRYPLCEVYAVNATVQGEEAPDSICRGILRAETAGCEVIIVGRGGGSSEDLSAFNNEKVVYAVYNCRVPVISAAGHETDYSLAALAADMRAPTPSAAAELASPSIESLYERLSMLGKRGRKAVDDRYKAKKEQLALLSGRLAVQSPENRLKLASERLESLTKRSSTAFAHYCDRLGAELGRSAARLDALSPLKILSRGYSLAYREGQLVKDSSAVSEGDMIELRFDKGGAEAEIKRIW